MASNPALDNVLAAAEAAAANFTPPAVVSTGNNVPAAANQNSNSLAKPTMADVLNGGGLSVDQFLQNKAEGFKISKDMKGLLESIVVEIDLSDVTVIYSSRHELAGKTTFLKSYDGVRTDQGENFEAKIRHFDATGYKGSGIYQTVEIPCELLEDVKDPKSPLVVPAGTTIGITPSLTGFKEFQKLMKKLAKTNPELLEDVVKVKVEHLQRTNTSGNEWGVCTFALAE